MPVPSLITDLSETASQNSPSGSETVGTNANEYLQAGFAFIRQIYDRVVTPTASVNMNGQKVTNIAQGTISSTSTDAVRGDQLYKIGELKCWHGAAANITTTWGAGWQIADGTNGTMNMVDRIPIGSGNLYTIAVTGGATTATLTTDNMPAHTHTTTVTDNGHVHTITDNGHAHASTGSGFVVSGAANNVNNSYNGPNNAQIINSTATATTGITIASATTGITVANDSVGSGAAFSIMPPYVGVLWIEYVGA